MVMFSNVTMALAIIQLGRIMLVLIMEVLALFLDNTGNYKEKYFDYFPMTSGFGHEHIDAGHKMRDLSF
jgi:hypothetical protein